MIAFLAGAVMMGYALAGLFLLKFWNETRDRLFFLFALALWILALNEAMQVVVPAANQWLPIYYIVRLLGFLVILAAIIDKNSKARP